MNTFSPRKALVEFGLTPLDAAYLNAANGRYEKVLPFGYCGLDRGFYFHVTLVEYDFELEHSHKLSMCGMGPDPVRKKSYKDLDGTTITVGIFEFYIFVNRTHFKRMSEREDYNEWATGSLTARRKAIAHELLYADQYARNYDWNSQSLVQPIVIPTVEEESALQCPDCVTARFLHTAQEYEGIELTSSSDFLASVQTKTIQNYYRQWLTEQAVDRDTCHFWTLRFLDKGWVPGIWNFIGNTLISCSQTYPPGPHDALSFKQCMKNGHAFRPAYVSAFQSQYSGIQELSIVDLTVYHLELKDR
jgi:hypothetical protein